MTREPVKWTSERVDAVLRILPRYDTLAEGLDAVSRAVGFPVSRHALDGILVKYGHKPAWQHLKNPYSRPIPAVNERDTERFPVATAAELPDDSATTPAGPPHERFAALVEVVKRRSGRGGMTLEELCDELRMSPRTAREYLAAAANDGITVDIAHERLLFRAPEPAPSAPATAVAPSTILGQDHRIGVFSDMHFGSSYCLREQLRDFVLRCYHDLGVRDFFCPGDIVEGCYRHAQFERSSESLDAQQGEFLDALPQLEGMRVFFIDGNHDFTFTEKTGVEAGRNLVRLARERGRNDLHFFGSRGALIQYGDTRIELWHPKKGKAYAISYQLQNKIRDTAPARLPNILLCGHVHEYVKFRRSDVWAFYCGTFQHGDAPYGRSIGGDVAMGGLVIEWRVDPDGVVRHLGDMFYLANHDAKVFDVAV